MGVEIAGFELAEFDQETQQKYKVVKDHFLGLFTLSITADLMVGSFKV